MSLDQRGLAQCYLYEAYSVADHAGRLTDEARHALEHGDIAGAISWLEQALKQAESAPYRITDAIEQLRKALP